MRRVILESPYAGDIEANVEYARRCVRDSLARGEAPIEETMDTQLDRTIRVQGIPKAEWERRHAAKVALGIAKA